MLSLNTDTDPQPVDARIWVASVCLLDSAGNKIRIGPVDFRCLVEYWLTNTDMKDDDERLKLIGFVEKLSLAPGFNADQTRLVSPHEKK